MVLLFSDHLRYMKNLNIGFFHISSFWHIRKLNVCGEKLFFYVICMKVFWISGTGKTPKWKRMRFELLISCKKIRWCYICEQLVKSKKSKYWIFQKSKYWIYQKLNVCGEKLFFYVICMKVFWISGTCKTPKWKRMRFELLISCKKIRWCYICEQLVTHMRVFWLIWFVWRVIQEKKKNQKIYVEKNNFSMWYVGGFSVFLAPVRLPNENVCGLSCLYLVKKYDGATFVNILWNPKNPNLGFSKNPKIRKKKKSIFGVCANSLFKTDRIIISSYRNVGLLDKIKTIFFKNS